MNTLNANQLSFLLTNNKLVVVLYFIDLHTLLISAKRSLEVSTPDRSYKRRSPRGVVQSPSDVAGTSHSPMDTTDVQSLLQYSTASATGVGRKFASTPKRPQSLMQTYRPPTLTPLYREQMLPPYFIDKNKSPTKCKVTSDSRLSQNFLSFHIEMSLRRCSCPGNLIFSLICLTFMTATSKCIKMSGCIRHGN